MADLFEEKAKEWDVNEMVRQLSSNISGAMIEHVPFDTTMCVMDFGAGTGLISSNIAPHVKQIKAVDISQSMLEQLAEKAELKDKVEIACQNILEIPLNEKFDVIMSAMAMHHVEDTDKMLSSFASHLKPGGQVALADLDAEDGTFHPADVEGVYHPGFDRAVFEKRLSANGFSEIKFVTAHTVDKEGKEYPIFLVTAKKQ